MAPEMGSWETSSEVTASTAGGRGRVGGGNTAFGKTSTPSIWGVQPAPSVSTCILLWTLEPRDAKKWSERDPRVLCRLQPQRKLLKVLVDLKG